MRPPIPISQARKDELVAFRKAKWSGFEFQRFLCVWLRVERAQTPEQIATTLGWHVNTVRATQQDFARHGPEQDQTRPGTTQDRQGACLSEDYRTPLPRRRGRREGTDLPELPRLAA